MSKIKNEPAVITSVIVALVGAAATLGLIGTDTQDQLVAVITAVVPLIGGLVVRASVTPNGKVVASTSGDAAVALTTDAAVNDTPEPETLEQPAPEPTPEPAAPAPVEDPVKTALKNAIETVRAQSNAANDARAQAAKNAVDASA